MKSSILPILSLILVLACVILSVYMYGKLTSLSLRVDNLEIAGALTSQNTTSTPESGGQITEGTSSDTTSSANEGSISTTPSISSAILFETTSSAALSPRVPLVVTIDSVQNPEPGMIRVILKVNTTHASSYTAIDPQSIITLLNEEGDVQKSSAVTGAWKSMPPKSSISGSLTFETPENKNTAILRIDSGNDITFYEFDFQKKTYKEK